MVAPVVIGLVKIYLVKKMALYYVAKQYGFHLLYRRLLEGMKTMNLTKEQQKIISNQLKAAIRFPQTAHKALSEVQTSSYLTHYFTNLDQLSQRLPNIPKVFFTFRDEVLYSKIPFLGRLIDIFGSTKKKP
jgi:hypothetical protein